MAKVMISIDDNLLSRVDTLADEQYTSRSGLITASVLKYLQEVEVVTALKDMSFCLKKISENGSVDDDLKEQLKDIQTILKYSTFSN